METKKEDRNDEGTDLREQTPEGGEARGGAGRPNSDPTDKPNPELLGGIPPAAVRPQPDPGPLMPDPEVLEGTLPAAVKPPADPDPKIDLLDGNS